MIVFEVVVSVLEPSVTEYKFAPVDPIHSNVRDVSVPLVFVRLLTGAGPVITPDKEAEPPTRPSLLIEMIVKSYEVFEGIISNVYVVVGALTSTFERLPPVGTILYVDTPPVDGASHESCIVLLSTFETVKFKTESGAVVIFIVDVVPP